MGNEHTRKMRLGYSDSIFDEALKAEVGLPNIYTPRPKLIELFMGKVPEKNSQRRKETFLYLKDYPSDSLTQKLILYAKLFFIGGIAGIFFNSVVSVFGRIQYFPFRKIEEFVGDQKRLSFYPAK